MSSGAAARLAGTRPTGPHESQIIGLRSCRYRFKRDDINLQALAEMVTAIAAGLESGQLVAR